MIKSTGRIVGSRPIIFGEVLFDLFPDGRQILGGAPFNVAWHLGGFGQKPLMISRVGNDRQGQEILRRMQAWDLDTAGMQIDEKLPTGTVEVSFLDGEPTYDIARDRAYDAIDSSQALEAVHAADGALLYQGTLAARADISARTLDQLIERASLPVFTDLNLRAPWWDAIRIKQTLKTSRWVKLNREELSLIKPDTAEETACLELIASYGLDWIIVTHGPAGAVLYSSTGQRIFDKPAESTGLVDTVGAGDAFCAVILLGLLSGWPLETSLKRAGEFAAIVCTIQGATTDNLVLYEKVMKRWR